MSARNTLAYGQHFNLHSEAIEGGVYLELRTCDVELLCKDTMPNVLVRVRLPNELLNRLTLDGKPIEAEPGWAENHGGGWEFQPKKQ